MCVSRLSPFPIPDVLLKSFGKAAPWLLVVAGAVVVVVTAVSSALLLAKTETLSQAADVSMVGHRSARPRGLTKPVPLRTKLISSSSSLSLSLSLSSGAPCEARYSSLLLTTTAAFFFFLHFRAVFSDNNFSIRKSLELSF